MALLTTSRVSAALLRLLFGSLECFKGLAVLSRKYSINSDLVLKVFVVGERKP